MEIDARARIALSQLAGSADRGEPAPAAVSLERGRIAALLQAFIRQTPADGGAIRPGG
jgi:hypothetical protein